MFNAPRATIWLQDTTGAYRAAHTLGVDDQITRGYIEYYGHRDLLRPAIVGASAGTVLTNEMVVPQSDFVRTEFYADFAAPHGLIDSIQARVFEGADFSGYVGVTRSLQAGTFGREHVRLLHLLLPHLNRAMQMQVRLTFLGVERDSALEALNQLRHGVLVVDSQVRVLHANNTADAILRKWDGLGLEPTTRRLRAGTPSQTSALRYMVMQAATGGHEVAIPGQGGGNGVFRLDRVVTPPILLCVAPLRARTAWNVSSAPAALLLLSIPEHRTPPPLLDCLRALYGLTPTEAAVAGRIGRAEEVGAAAEAMKITPATLRWHLQRIFAKTNTARQAELVRVVERIEFLNGGENRANSPLL